LINYRYIRTYLARLIQTEDEIKGFYGELKNKFLSYEKVKSRISKKYESFNCGRNNLAKLDVRGKKINLYLALDPKEFAEKAQFYNFIDVSEKKKETPMLIKVSGPIKLRRALELVEILMEKIGAGVIENYEKVDYMMPYEDTDSLVRKGLIIDLWGQTPEVAEVQEIEEFAVSASVEETSKNNAEEEKVKEILEPNAEVVDGENHLFEPSFEESEQSDEIITPEAEELPKKDTTGEKGTFFKRALNKLKKSIKKNKDE
jgi:hypothetical protein